MAEYCTCETDEPDFHSCPYKEESDGDFETECTCCEYCTNECAMDI